MLPLKKHYSEDGLPLAPTSSSGSSLTWPTGSSVWVPGHRDISLSTRTLDFNKLIVTHPRTRTARVPLFCWTFFQQPRRVFLYETGVSAQLPVACSLLLSGITPALGPSFAPTAGPLHGNRATRILSVRMKLTAGHPTRKRQPASPQAYNLAHSYNPREPENFFSQIGVQVK